MSQVLDLHDPGRRSQPELAEGALTWCAIEEREPLWIFNLFLTTIDLQAFLCASAGRSACRDRSADHHRQRGPLQLESGFVISSGAVDSRSACLELHFVLRSVLVRPRAEGQSAGVGEPSCRICYGFTALGAGNSYGYPPQSPITNEKCSQHRKVDIDGVGRLIFSPTIWAAGCPQRVHRSSIADDSIECTARARSNTR